ncbi:MAG: dTDP-4-dehydrorhamnose 3,5-epimerase [Candidatus Riflebacteria bacterium]|nr:dTDP-4-dehydrorhamnose 3,5-epimerase [Candidatus Riflebacteria bacterium]
MDPIKSDLKQPLIKDVKLFPLNIIPDPRGDILHMVKPDSPFFKKFGEVYFSKVNPKAIKAWKIHLEATQNIAVPYGKIKIVLCRLEEKSKTIELFELGAPDKYHLLVIPPGIWYGFQCISDYQALIANCSDLPHNPLEMERKQIADTEINFSDWLL